MLKDFGEEDGVFIGMCNREYFFRCDLRLLYEFNFYLNFAYLLVPDMEISMRTSVAKSAYERYGRLCRRFPNHIDRVPILSYRNDVVLAVYQVGPRPAEMHPEIPFTWSPFI